MRRVRSFPRFFSFPKVIDLFTPLLFIYFLTLHADYLHIHVGGHVRLNNLLAFGLVILLMIRLRGNFFKIERRILIALLLIIASILVSLAFSPHMKRCTLHGAWFFFTLLCYFWMPYQLLDKFSCDKVLKLYFLSFGVVGVYAICQLFTCPLFTDPTCTQHLGVLGRPSALCYEPSYYVLYMTPFVFLQTLLYFGKDPAVSGKKIVFLFVCYFVSMVTGSLFACIFFVIFTAFFRAYRHRLLSFSLKLLIVLLPILVFGGAVVWNTFLKHGLNIAKHPSVQERWINSKHCMTLFMQRPVIGYGLGGVPPERVEQGLYLAKYDELEIDNWNKVAEPSNIATEVLSSLGLVGACTFVVLFAAYATSHFRKRRVLCMKEDPETKRLVLWYDAFFISTIIMLLTWQFSQALMRPYCWTHFAFAAAFLRTTQPFGRSPYQEVSTQTLCKAV